MTHSRVVRVHATGVGHVTRRDAERVRDETSGIGPGSSGCRDGVRTRRGTSHNKLLRYCKSGTAQYLVSGLLSQFDSIFHQTRQPDFELDVAWVKGHMDIEGNEMVDKAAKEATGGESSEVLSLPTLLATNPLPVSVSVSKQDYGAWLHERWHEIWKRSPCHVRISKVDPSLPSNKFQKLMVECSRAQASLIIQLRTGHVLLNAYLHRISKLDQPLCHLCERGDKTVHHYLFDCTAWAHE